MKLEKVFILTLTLCILIIQVPAIDQYSEENNNNYRAKRSITPNFIHPLEIGSATSQTEKNTYSAWDPSSGLCMSNPCEHGGICVSKYNDYRCICTNDYYGKNCQIKFFPYDLDDNCQPNICNTGRCISLRTGYYCQCPNDHYGEHCERRLHRRSIPNRQLYYGIFNEMKRNAYEQHDAIKKGDGERIYYDYKNGFYL